MSAKWKVTSINEPGCVWELFWLPTELYETSEDALDAARREIVKSVKSYEEPEADEHELGFSCTATRTDGEQSCWANVCFEWNDGKGEWELDLWGEHSTNSGTRNYCSEFELMRLGDDYAPSEGEDETKSDDQDYECKSWWEIRDVRHKGFDNDRVWGTDDGLLEPFKLEQYDEPGEAADAVYKQLKTNTEQAVMDDSFGAGWSIEVQKVEEVRKFDGERHRYEDVDVRDECCVYYITRRWDKDRERYDIDFADDEDEIEKIFAAEFIAAEQRQIAHNEKAAKPSKDPEPDMDPDIEM